MNLDDLKKHWELEQSSKSENEIAQLIAQRSESVSARNRRKALIEAGAFVVLLLVFFTGLDPERNSLLVNLFLALVVITGIVNNLLLYRKLLVNKRGDNLTQSLEKQIRAQWQQLQFSVLFSVLFFSAVCGFLLLRTEISGPDFWLIPLLLGLSIAIRSWFEIGRWKKSIRQLTRCQMELKAAEAKT
jgi:hypothetical protein